MFFSYFFHLPLVNKILIIRCFFDNRCNIKKRRELEIYASCSYYLISSLSGHYQKNFSPRCCCCCEWIWCEMVLWISKTNDWIRICAFIVILSFPFLFPGFISMATKYKVFFFYLFFGPRRRHRYLLNINLIRFVCTSLYNYRVIFWPSISMNWALWSLSYFLSLIYINIFVSFIIKLMSVVQNQQIYFFIISSDVCNLFVSVVIH